MRKSPINLDLITKAAAKIILPIYLHMIIGIFRSIGDLESEGISRYTNPQFQKKPRRIGDKDIINRSLFQGLVRT